MRIMNGDELTAGQSGFTNYLINGKMEFINTDSPVNYSGMIEINWNNVKSSTIKQFIEVTKVHVNATKAAIRKLIFDNAPVQLNPKLPKSWDFIQEQNIFQSRILVGDIVSKFRIKRSDVKLKGSCQHTSFEPKNFDMPQLSNDFNSHVSKYSSDHENEQEISNRTHIEELCKSSCYILQRSYSSSDLSLDQIIKSRRHSFVSCISSAPAVFCHVNPRVIRYGGKHFKDGIYRTPCSTASTCASFQSPIISETSLCSDNFVSPFLEEDDILFPDMPDLDQIEIQILDEDSIKFIQTERDGDFILVGQGTYGGVYLAEIVKSNELVCVKEYISEVTSPVEVVKEAKMLTYLQDTGIVPEICGVLRNQINPEELSLVQEFCAHGRTLKEQLKAKNDRWTEQEVFQVLHGLVTGLSRIHMKQVLWNDLKPDNILIDTRQGIELTFIDFRVATLRSSRRFSVLGKMELFSYLAPEVRGGYPTSEASDIYSLGYLMMSILSSYDISYPELLDIVENALHKQPECRPSLVKLLKAVEHFL